MRSERDDEDKIKALIAEQRRLREALTLIQVELSQLYIAKKKTTDPPSITTTHPVGRRVRIVNRRDPAGLYKATAIVTGHTKARIKICIDDTEYLRAASSLKPLKNE